MDEIRPFAARPADILLPRTGDMTAWSVVACDQFTSQPEYWRRAEERIGDAPSALRMILPEAWLGTEKAGDAEDRIAAAMEEYLDRDLFAEVKDSFIYVERTQPDGRVRRGLMAALDLEQYDFAPGARTPVRATEGTVEERLPPRVRIRARAALELPHAMVLMDDRDERVLCPLEAAKHRMKKLYDFELMLGGGRIAGWRVSGPLAETVQQALCSLGDAALQREKYGEAAENGPLVFAVGDGNHSLAAAKRWWDELKETLSDAERRTHPARYALAELVNIHDPALDFEPIHRVLFDTDGNVSLPDDPAWSDPKRTIGERVSAADAFCREAIAAHGGRVDYVHGDAAARELGSTPGCAAVLLPPVRKDGLFLSVLKNGALPRKSFSMGHAEDKRYYLECRRIR
ncbi:MAG: DUF1015 domain-containing protein [Oscillospiraceae bacterium]|nr:DUF1015 domain-containing protein [Oscillospiraceae bacterium]